MTLPIDYQDARPPTGALTELPATTPRGLNAINAKINANTAAIAAIVPAVTVSSTTALRALTATTASGVRLLGYYAAGDGGGGLFRWDSTDTTSTDNGGTIITPTSGLSASGRWKRVYEGFVNARWFGVNPSQTDNTAVLQKAVDWVALVGGGRVFIPAGWYNFTFSGASTITIAANDVLPCGDGTATVLRVTGSHTRPSQVSKFFTYSVPGSRGQGGGMRDLTFYGASMLKRCIYLDTWRNAQFENISAFEIHEGIIDAEATHTTLYGEGITVAHLDLAGIGGNVLSQYAVRFRSSASAPNTTWSDCTIRDVDGIYVWDSAVILDGVQRFTTEGNITASNNGTSTDTSDGTSKTGCRNAIRIDNTIDKTIATGWHVINSSTYLEMVTSTATASVNNAIYLHEPTGINSRIKGVQINGGTMVSDDGTNIVGLLKLSDDSGVGRLIGTGFRGNRCPINGNITIGAGVTDTDLYLTPADGRDWSPLISDAGTNTRVNGGLPTPPAAAVLRTLPAVYDPFTAADSSTPDTGRWATTVGSGSGASVNIQGNALQLKTGATGGGSVNDNVALTSTLGTTLADGELEFCLISSAVTVESYFVAALRAANVIPFSGATAYYVFLAQNSSGSLQTLVGKHVASSQTILYTGPGITQTAGQKTWYRFRVKGTSLTLWTWADGAAIPTTPTWTGTDSAVTGGGYATFSLGSGTAAASGIQKIDNVAIYAL